MKTFSQLVHYTKSIASIISGTLKSAVFPIFLWELDRRRMKYTQEESTESLDKVLLEYELEGSAHPEEF